MMNMLNAFVNWLREEWRLMRLADWGDGKYREGPHPCSHDHPSVKALAEKQAAVAAQMRRMRMRLVDSKDRKYANSDFTDIRVTIDQAKRMKTGAVRRVR